MPILLIAEAGVNHNGDIDTAKSLVDAAKKANCNAVKFQTFKADKLVTKFAQKADYQIDNTGTNETQFEMLKNLELSEENHWKLYNYCRQQDILFLSTPFDEESADFLEAMGMKIFKIPSGEITNKNFIKHIAKKRKTIILSTGMSTLGEVEEALEWIYEEGCKKVILLHCVSSYPADFKDVNLNAIRTLRECFKVKVGYSDHTVGTEASIAAAALGADVIEKHITLDRTMEGPDHKLSLEPLELEQMVTAIRNIEAALGDGKKRPTERELELRKNVRKYIVTEKNIYTGQTITSDMLSVKRAGGGFDPKYLELIIGAIAAKDMPYGHVIEKGDFF
ncbi:MAG: N-acetylneuraminate synthase [Bacillota bacterium]|nr:N-acetylneuraminate synthase [Bacillota bacterium]